MADIQCIAQPFMKTAWHAFNGLAMWVEVVYFLIVFVACMLIYFKTKKLYELSGHQGIRLFRYAFFFFALTTLVKIFMRGLRLFIQGPPHHSIYFIVGLFLMSVFGTMSVLCLVGSITWKRLPRFSRAYIFLIVSVFVSLFIPFFRGHGIMFMVISQTVLFMIAAVLSYWNHLGSKGKKKKSTLYAVYLLLLVAWLINIVAQFVVLISFTMSILLYAISAAFFVVIVYRVLKVIK